MQENPELQIHAVPRARGSIWKWLFASAAVAVLAACGGGGGASADIANPANATLVQGTLSTGLVVPTASEASAASVVTSSDGTGLVLANRTGSMQSIKTGQVVVLPSNDTQGLPMGFTGIASVQSDGSIKLTPASISDVFKTLKVDFDSARDGGQIAGLIVPRNGKMTMSQSPAPSTQSGLDMVLCQIGLNAVVNVKCKNGALEGSITLEHPVMVKEKGGTKQAQAKLYATIGISNFSSKANIDYDFEKYASTGGFNILKSEVTGAWSASPSLWRRRRRAEHRSRPRPR